MTNWTAPDVLEAVGIDPAAPTIEQAEMAERAANLLNGTLNRKTNLDIRWALECLGVAVTRRVASEDEQIIRLMRYMARFTVVAFGICLVHIICLFIYVFAGVDVGMPWTAGLSGSLLSVSMYMLGMATGFRTKQSFRDL